MSETIMLSQEGYSYKALFPLALQCLKKGVSVLVLGHPGGGKTTMGKELAAELGIPYIILRIAHHEPGELVGMGFPNRETREVEWFRPAWFPKDPSLIILDEINAGVSKLHQSIAYQIALDGGIGDFKFPEGTRVFATGNLIEDNAIVTPLSTALTNRFACFVLKPDVEAWLEWAETVGIPAEYRAYIAWRREKALYDNYGGTAFPTPRSNELAARLSADVDNEVIKKRLIEACIGEVHAKEYVTFMKIYRDVNLKDIVEKGIIPEVTKAEKSFLYALVYSLASYISTMSAHKLAGKRVANIVKLLSSFDSMPEYQTVFLKLLVDVLGRKKGFFDALRTCPEFLSIAPKLSVLFSEA